MPNLSSLQLNSFMITNSLQVCFSWPHNGVLTIILLVFHSKFRKKHSLNSLCFLYHIPERIILPHYRGQGIIIVIISVLGSRIIQPAVVAWHVVSDIIHV